MLRSGSRPFAWGSLDCCLWAADWVLARSGRDPAAPLRGGYWTEAGAGELVRRAGGILALVSQHVAAIGLVEAADPAPGDLGVVQFASGRSPALWTGEMWVAKAQTGIFAGRYPHLVAWSVPCLP